MQSGSRFGIVAAVVFWEQKIIISRSLHLRSSASQSRPPSLCAPQSFNPVRSILRVRSGFNASRSFSPHQSFSKFNSSCRQQRKGSSRRTYSVITLSFNSSHTFSSRLKTGGASYRGASSACSSPLRCPSVILRRPGMGQLKRRNRRSTRRSQQKTTIFVGAIASVDEPETDLNQKISLHEELERYGVHESDYTCHKFEPLDPNFSHDMKEHKPTRGSSSMPRKRKATADLTNGSKQQHPPSKQKSDVVQEWCCYLLLSVDSKKTYVGVTFDIIRRLRQHNGEISGGAKSARAGRPWRVVCTVQGFISRSEACQFEWRWKSTAAKYKTIVQHESETEEPSLVTRRRATLAKVLKVKDDWTYLHVQWHAD